MPPSQSVVWDNFVARISTLSPPRSTSPAESIVFDSMHSRMHPGDLRSRSTSPLKQEHLSLRAGDHFGYSTYIWNEVARGTLEESI